MASTLGLRISKWRDRGHQSHAIAQGPLGRDPALGLTETRIPLRVACGWLPLLRLSSGGSAILHAVNPHSQEFYRIDEDQNVWSEVQDCGLDWAYQT